LATISNSRAGQTRASAASAVRKTKVCGKQLPEYGQKSVMRLKDLYLLGGAVLQMVASYCVRSSHRAE
jgi:hypothetical protein